MMNYQAALQELYPKEWASIAMRLGAAIIQDNANELDSVIQTYFLGPEARTLLNGYIAYVPPKKKDGDGDLACPAFLAIERSSMKSLEKILRATGDPNARVNPNDPGSATLLIYASVQGDSEATKLLMTCGADVNIGMQGVDGSVYTALSMAVSNGYMKLAKLLMENGAEISFGAAVFAITRSEKVLSPILEDFVKHKPTLITETPGSALNVPQGSTLLHCASELGNLATVRWLIEKGADINAVDENGHTPRDLAEHEAIEKHLAAIGALTKSEISPTLAPPEPQMTYSEKREITDLIDRLELLEDKCGIRVEAVYATCEGSIVNGVGEYSLEVNCDIVGTGATLERSFHLRLNAYNPAGQLIKTGTDFISAGDFSGFQSCSIRLYCDHFPHRLRLFPS